MGPVSSDTLIVLTRPAGQNRALKQALSQHGLNSLVLPALHIRPQASLAAEPLDPADFDLIVFVSRHAVRFFMQAWQGVTRAAWPSNTLAATVGQGSAAPLYADGVVPTRQIVHPPLNSAQDSEALLALLEARLPSVRRALIVRGQDGREWLGEQLAERGVQVVRHTAYMRAPYRWPTARIEALRQRALGKGLVWVLTSSQSVQAVYEQLQEHNLLTAWQGARFVVIHERIASRLQSLLQPMRFAEPISIHVCSPGDASVVQAVLTVAATRDCQGLQSRHD